MQLLLLCLCLDMKIEVAGEDLQNMISKKSEFVTSCYWQYEVYFYQMIFYFTGKSMAV